MKNLIIASHRAFALAHNSAKAAATTKALSTATAAAARARARASAESCGFSLEHLRDFHLALDTARQIVYYLDADLTLHGYSLTHSAPVLKCPLVMPAEAEEQLLSPRDRVVGLAYLPELAAVIVATRHGTLVKVDTTRASHVPANCNNNKSLNSHNTADADNVDAADGDYNDEDDGAAFGCDFDIPEAVRNDPAFAGAGSCSSNKASNSNCSNSNNNKSSDPAAVPGDVDPNTGDCADFSDSAAAIEDIEVVGHIDGGLAAAAWSPDCELLALVTCGGSLLLMTAQWEPVAEVPAVGTQDAREAVSDANPYAHLAGTRQNAERVAARALGTTAKTATLDSNTHGGTNEADSAGTTAHGVDNTDATAAAPSGDGNHEDDEDEALMAVAVPEACISWRGDGQFFAVSTLERASVPITTPVLNAQGQAVPSAAATVTVPAGARCRVVRVWDRLCALQSESEPAPVTCDPHACPPSARLLTMPAPATSTREEHATGSRTTSDCDEQWAFAVHGGMQSLLAWRPSGALIAAFERSRLAAGAGGRTVPRLATVLLERNGLRHGEFSLIPPPQPFIMPPAATATADTAVAAASSSSSASASVSVGMGMGMVVTGAAWSADSEVLAIWGIALNNSDPQSPSSQSPCSQSLAHGQCSQSPSHGARQVQLWHRSNYHWYLKRRLDFPPPCLGTMGSLAALWQPERPHRLIIQCDSTVHAVDLCWDIAAAPATALGSVAVVDGSVVKLTYLAKAAIPPPLAARALLAPSPVAEAAFCSTGSSSDFGTTNANLNSTGSNSSSTTVATSSSGSGTGSDSGSTADTKTENETESGSSGWHPRSSPGASNARSDVVSPLATLQSNGDILLWTDALPARSLTPPTAAAAPVSTHAPASQPERAMGLASGPGAGAASSAAAAAGAVPGAFACLSAAAISFALHHNYHASSNNSNGNAVVQEFDNDSNATADVGANAKTETETDTELFDSAAAAADVPYGFSCRHLVWAQATQWRSALAAANPAAFSAGHAFPPVAAAARKKLGRYGSPAQANVLLLVQTRPNLPDRVLRIEFAVQFVLRPRSSSVNDAVSSPSNTPSVLTAADYALQICLQSLVVDAIELLPTALAPPSKSALYTHTGLPGDAADSEVTVGSPAPLHSTLPPSLAATAATALSVARVWLVSPGRPYPAPPQQLTAEPTTTAAAATGATSAAAAAAAVEDWARRHAKAEAADPWLAVALVTGAVIKVRVRPPRSRVLKAQSPRRWLQQQQQQHNSNYNNGNAVNSSSSAEIHHALALARARAVNNRHFATDATASAAGAAAHGVSTGGRPSPWAQNLGWRLPVDTLWFQVADMAGVHVCLGKDPQARLFVDRVLVAPQCISFAQTAFPPLPPVNNTTEAQSNANAVSAAALRPAFLLVTVAGATHALFTLDLRRSLAANLAPLGPVRTDPHLVRYAEQGSAIVAAVPDALRARIVLQMPRGNLELVYPRTLGLAAVHSALSRGRWLDAFLAARASRIDLNLLWDHDPAAAATAEAADAVVAQLGSAANLALLLSALAPEDCTQTQFPRYHAMFASAGDRAPLEAALARLQSKAAAVSAASVAAAGSGSESDSVSTGSDDDDSECDDHDEFGSPVRRTRLRLRMRESNGGGNDSDDNLNTSDCYDGHDDGSRDGAFAHGFLSPLAAGAEAQRKARFDRARARDAAVAGLTSTPHAHGHSTGGQRNDSAAAAAENVHDGDYGDAVSSTGPMGSIGATNGVSNAKKRGAGANDEMADMALLARRLGQSSATTATGTATGAAAETAANTANAAHHHPDMGLALGAEANAELTRDGTGVSIVKAASRVVEFYTENSDLRHVYLVAQMEEADAAAAWTANPTVPRLSTMTTAPTTNSTSATPPTAATATSAGVNANVTETVAASGDDAVALARRRAAATGANKVNTACRTYLAAIDRADPSGRRLVTAALTAHLRQCPPDFTGAMRRVAALAAAEASAAASSANANPANTVTGTSMSAPAASAHDAYGNATAGLPPPRTTTLGPRPPRVGVSGLGPADPAADRHARVTAEAALRFALVVADSNELWRAALALYDLPLAAATARSAGRDPREYLPLLAGWRRLGAEGPAVSPLQLTPIALAAAAADAATDAAAAAAATARTRSVTQSSSHSQSEAEAEAEDRDALTAVSASAVAAASLNATAVSAAFGSANAAVARAAAAAATALQRAAIDAHEARPHRALAHWARALSALRVITSTGTSTGTCTVGSAEAARALRVRAALLAAAARRSALDTARKHDLLELATHLYASPLPPRPTLAHDENTANKSSGDHGDNAGVGRVVVLNARDAFARSVVLAYAQWLSTTAPPAATHAAGAGAVTTPGHQNQDATSRHADAAEAFVAAGDIASACAQWVKAGDWRRALGLAAAATTYDSSDDSSIKNDADNDDSNVADAAAATGDDSSTSTAVAVSAESQPQPRSLAKASGVTVRVTGFSAHTLQLLARSAAAELKARRRPLEAAQVLADWLGDRASAVSVLITAGLWDEALLCAGAGGAAGALLSRTVVFPAIAAAGEAFAKDTAVRVAGYRAAVARLRLVRRVKLIVLGAQAGMPGCLARWRRGLAEMARADPKYREQMQHPMLLSRVPGDDVLEFVITGVWRGLHTGLGADGSGAGSIAGYSTATGASLASLAPSVAASIASMGSAASGALANSLYSAFSSASAASGASSVLTVAGADRPLTTEERRMRKGLRSAIQRKSKRKIREGDPREEADLVLQVQAAAPSGSLQARAERLIAALRVCGDYARARAVAAALATLETAAAEEEARPMPSLEEASPWQKEQIANYFNWPATARLSEAELAAKLQARDAERAAEAARVAASSYPKSKKELAAMAAAAEKDKSTKTTKNTSDAAAGAAGDAGEGDDDEDDDGSADANGGRNGATAFYHWWEAPVVAAAAASGLVSRLALLTCGHTGTDAKADVSSLSEEFGGDDFGGDYFTFASTLTDSTTTAIDANADSTTTTAAAAAAAAGDAVNANAEAEARALRRAVGAALMQTEEGRAGAVTMRKRSTMLPSGGPRAKEQPRL
mgnify:CR=1 FL=1